MAVRWPDGSYTGSVRVSKQAPAPSPVQEPEEIKAALIIESPDDKKEASHGSR